MGRVRISPAHRIDLLGRFAVVASGRRVGLRPSARRLVALLGVRGPTARGDAAGLLWPDLDQHRARDNLRTAYWRLRNDAPQLVTEEGEVLRIADACVDFDEVRQWAWQVMRGEDLPFRPSAGGPLELLPGWSDEWLVEFREEFRLLTLYALEGCAQRLLMAGRVGEAATLALTALGVDPLRESANRLLIEIEIRAGNGLDAVRQYRRYAHLLDREVQAEPGPVLTMLIAPHLRPPATSRHR